ncbi:S-adenosylmethionine:tRNA ribosyltransferase-isomerase [Sorangium sp. So ce590]|uniref:S-adenosylmethionine:tRNA ribosyltransferase-isomerase n=1 Tax=Sorangium sp. So ce590 TaxID=3133317 RepID=UPI003F5E2FF3
MSPAAWPRDNPLSERLLHVDPRLGRLRDARIADLPALLEPGDLLVVNDGATLPASLDGAAGRGAAVEVRLIGELSEGRYSALLFGAGDWRCISSSAPAEREKAE